MTSDAGEERTDRRRFLRHIGTALGVGVGAALALPSAAKAQGLCCNDDICDQQCPPENFGQRCRCEGFDYCLCFSQGYCHSAPC